MFNLLRENLISARLEQNTSKRSLPGVLAGLTHSEIVSFPALRPHQRHPWHAFLVQLAVIALQRAGRMDLPEDEDDWRGLLKALTAAWPNDEPWSLVVTDASQPAFMQPPVSGGDLKDFKDGPDTPDALDMLVTSKAHDLKGERMADASPEDWVFALVSLQTQEGVMGAGKYGVARMNGGYGSRAGFGVAPPGGIGARFRRDVERLLAADRDDAFPAGLDKTGNGIALLWVEPWDGETQIALNRLDSMFVEVCRRVRLVEEDGRLRALAAGSGGTRIAAASELKGATGDPWMPMERNANKALSLTGDGYTYRKLVDLLDREKFKRPLLAEVQGNDPAEGLSLLATGLARGQGKTEGYHERRIPIAKEARGFLMASGGDVLARAARARVDALGAVRGALRFALFILAQGGPEERADKPTTDGYVAPWLDRFEAEADRTFFEDLWKELTAPDFDARDRVALDWRKEKRDDALSLLDEAWGALPLPSVRRYRARVKATSAFHGALSKKDAFKQIYAEAAQKRALADEEAT